MTISRIGAARRYEDSQLFGEFDGYHHDRALDARQTLDDAFEKDSTEENLQLLAEWISRSVGTVVQTAPPLTQDREPGPRLEISMAPALIIRPRSKVLLAEAYKRIARELRDPNAAIPVALTQLVIDTEAEQRQQWIELQDGVTGEFLGSDPRFPLDVNPEQERVMELLRTETGVVVQGPPGTGKTHTIANLVSALLARGQRVLVTSQKDQALRVLRDKIPQELRNLCVLLAGGSKDAAVELQRGLDALSEAVATSDRGALRQRAESFTAERVRLRGAAALLNAEIRDLRETENRRHAPVAPWYSNTAYSGTLSDIVREVKHLESLHGWFPPSRNETFTGPPPVKAHELLRLRHLLVKGSSDRRDQWIPGVHEIPTLGAFAELVRAERVAADDARAVETPSSRQLVGLELEQLNHLRQLREAVSRLLIELGFDEYGVAHTAPKWVARAVNDLFAQRNHGLWGGLFELRDEAARIQSGIQAQGVAHVVKVSPIRAEDLGIAKGALRAGSTLEGFLCLGGKLKKRFLSREQANAAGFLSMVLVDGEPPKDLETVAAAVRYLDAEVAMMQLVEKWADCGIEIDPGRLGAVVSQLADNGARLDTIAQLLSARDQISSILESAGTVVAINSLTSFLVLLDSIPAVLSHLKYIQTQSKLEDLQRTVQYMAGHIKACPEVTYLVAALLERDAEAYERALAALAAARLEQADAAELAELSDHLVEAHQPLLSMLTQTAADEVWESRLAHIADAWAWYEAQRFVATWRSAERERSLTTQYMQLEDQIQRITARLAATEATLACLDRMSDDHARALRTYREHMANVGAGSGQRARVYQRAARAAMQKAKTAVPAWVVPLPNLLDNLPPDRNSFDVVIVDEASQVGMEQLFLLWLAPRVIVVGDNKQCTPGEARMGRHERVFQGLSRYLGDADPDIQTLFTPKTNLYGLLSARSGRDAVIRLREHFRCVPEIINWSSMQFYSVNGASGLIPLRERQVDDLAPLVTREIAGAYTEGHAAGLRNPVEAKAMADELVACLANPRYKGKTFGMVVLQGRGQVKLLEHEINVRISPEERENRKIRVGIASDFQGDERDIVFLSMVVADPPRAQKWTLAQQAYNVAASRAKDQLWLFTSVSMSDLKSDDLRASLLGYMQNPPSPYGASPALDEVSDTSPCPPFESLLEQRIFREIRGRGYHVVPQYAIGSRTLDLVVVGDGARVAVECDGHRYHTSPDQVASDARRDRELSRMKWEVIRVRESEFEYDSDRELAPLWAALMKRGIVSGATSEQQETGWGPAPLPADDEDDPQEEGGQ